MNIPVKTPPFFSKLREKPKRLLILSVGSLLFIVLFAVVINSLGKIGKNSTSETAAKAAESEVNWDKSRGRKDMTELKYTAMMVLDDIDTFKAEADKYHTDFDSLLNSAKGDSLKPVEGVLVYFQNQWKEELPRKLMAEMYREMVKNYLNIANEVLRKEDGGVYVPQDIYDEIRLIWVKTLYCKMLYRRHNQLLVALQQKIGEGPKVEPKSIKAAIIKAESEHSLKEVKVLPIQDLESIAPSSSYFTGVSSKPDPALDYLDSLFRKQNKNLLDKERAREAKETLMRDALPDRSAE
ncbi:MAG: hypothetical protein IT426_21080 [Pirellulales bacterium]|nr:hypothetical protein [Pirellulales bacterium]